MSAERKIIFVYGTLKQGCSNHAYLAGQKFLGEASTPPGFRLYELNGYPGMVAYPGDREGVTGELWSVDAATLAQLDALEGLAEGLYRREAITLPPPFADQAVETYLYAKSIQGRRETGPTWQE